MKGSYPRFAAMIATSTVLMFAFMYLNTYQADHVFFSETRAYMALVMGATMAVIMLAFMLKMHTNPRVNTGIFIGSAVVFGATKAQCALREVDGAVERGDELRRKALYRRIGDGRQAVGQQLRVGEHALLYRRLGSLYGM